MELDWKQADFQNTVQLEGVNGDRLRLSQEALAKDLSINLSAFLRTSLTVHFTSAGETIYGDFVKEHAHSCFSLTLTRPEQHKLLVVRGKLGAVPVDRNRGGSQAGNVRASGAAAD